MTSGRPRRRSSTGDGRSHCKPLHPVPSWEPGYGGEKMGSLWTAAAPRQEFAIPGQQAARTHVAAGPCALSTLIQELWFGVVANQQDSGLPVTLSRLAG